MNDIKECLCKANKQTNQDLKFHAESSHTESLKRSEQTTEQLHLVCLFCFVCFMWHCVVIYSEIEELKSLPGLLNTTSRRKTGIITEEIRGQKWYYFNESVFIILLTNSNNEIFVQLECHQWFWKTPGGKKYLKEH